MMVDRITSLKGSSRPSSALLRYLPVLALGFALAACASPYDDKAGQHNPEYFELDRHKIEVAATDRVLALGFVENDTQLDPDLREEFDAFVSDFVRQGDGLLIVEVGNADAETTANKLITVGKLVRAHGVHKNDLAVRDAPAGAMADISLVYTKYTASVKGCPDWSDVGLGGPKNVVHTNFGCAARSNLSKMVVNPKDLVVKRKASPPEADSVTRAVREHREGESEKSVGDLLPSLGN